MKFEFTIEQTNLLMFALSKLPYEQSADMIQNIRTQAQPQLPQPPEAEPTAVGGTD